jgi:hypothetical protein
MSSHRRRSNKSRTPSRRAQVAAIVRDELERSARAEGIDLDTEFFPAWDAACGGSRNRNIVPAILAGAAYVRAEERAKKLAALIKGGEADASSVPPIDADTEAAEALVERVRETKLARLLHEALLMAEAAEKAEAADVARAAIKAEKATMAAHTRKEETRTRTAASVTRAAAAPKSTILPKTPVAAVFATLPEPDYFTASEKALYGKLSRDAQEYVLFLLELRRFFGKDFVDDRVLAGALQNFTIVIATQKLMYEKAFEAVQKWLKDEAHVANDGLTYFTVTSLTNACTKLLTTTGKPLPVDKSAYANFKAFADVARGMFDTTAIMTSIQIADALTDNGFDTNTIWSACTAAITPPTAARISETKRECVSTYLPQLYTMFVKAVLKESYDWMYRHNLLSYEDATKKKENIAQPILQAYRASEDSSYVVSSAEDCMHIVKQCVAFKDTVLNRNAQSATFTAMHSKATDVRNLVLASNNSRSIPKLIELYSAYLNALYRNEAATYYLTELPVEVQDKVNDKLAQLGQESVKYQAYGVCVQLNAALAKLELLPRISQPSSKTAAECIETALSTSAVSTDKGKIVQTVVDFINAFPKYDVHFANEDAAPFNYAELTALMGISRVVNIAAPKVIAKTPLPDIARRAPAGTANIHTLAELATGGSAFAAPEVQVAAAYARQREGVKA